MVACTELCTLLITITASSVAVQAVASAASTSIRAHVVVADLSTSSIVA